MLPVFLLGALGGPLRAELEVSEAALGALITVLFLASSLTATTAGVATEHFGAGVTIRAGVAVSGLATAAIGALAQRWWHVAVLMALVGMCVSLVDTGVARVFADRVAARRHGTAFGVKEASVPGASLLAGVALPALATPFGWRVTFVAAIAVAVVVLVAFPRGRHAPRSHGPRSLGPTDAPPADRAGERPAAAPGGGATSSSTPARRPVALLAVGVGLAIAAATAAATFLVPAATARGVAPGAAGILLATASVASIVVRLVVGRWADTATARPAHAIAVLTAVGAVGSGLLAVTAVPALVVLGAVVVLGAGWGWTGLAFLAVVRARPEAPAAAAGVVLTGLGAGGGLGPLGFGWIVGRAGYPLAWSAAAVVLGLGAVVIGFAARDLER